MFRRPLCNPHRLIASTMKTLAVLAVLTAVTAQARPITSTPSYHSMQIRIGIEKNKLRISNHSFGDWVIEKEYSRHIMLEPIGIGTGLGIGAA